MNNEQIEAIANRVNQLEKAFSSAAKQLKNNNIILEEIISYVKKFVDDNKCVDD